MRKKGGDKLIQPIERSQSTHVVDEWKKTWEGIIDEAILAFEQSTKILEEKKSFPDFRILQALFSWELLITKELLYGLNLAPSDGIIDYTMLEKQKESWIFKQIKEWMDGSD